MSTVILLIFSALLGPVAGGSLPHRGSTSIAVGLIGLIFGYIICGWSWWMLAGAPVMIVGEMPGVGQPKGMAIDGKSNDLEWWQPEMLRNSPYYSLALRGALFGLPAILLYQYISYLWLIPAMAVGMPAGMWLAKKLGTYFIDVNIWRFSELLQYPIAGLMLWILA